MELIDKLMNEHQLILKYIDVIFSITKLKDEGFKKKFAKDHGRKIIDFIQRYADHYHHGKEEDILFVYMTHPDGRLHCNPIPQMLYEHKAGRETTRKMLESLEKEDYDLFFESAIAYGILLQDHIMKEDRILYPMAIEGLLTKHKEMIQHEYESVEGKLKNEKNYQQHYEDLLLNLKNQIK